MSTPSHKPGRDEQDLEQLLALARRADPGEGSTTDARRRARRAVLASNERRRGSRTRRNLVFVALASSALVLLAAWSPLRHAARDGLAALLAKHYAVSSSSGSSQPTTTRAPWKPLELALPTGDRLFASPGAQFDLLENTVATRRIALREGTAVFAVEPLVQGEQFSVQTPHLRVLVRGTVFSVEVDAHRTRVRVHEGAVLVESDSAERSLRAGERYGSDKTAVPELVSEPLSKRVAELLVERMQRKAEEATREHGDRDASVGPGHEPPKLEPSVTPKLEPSVTLEQARALMHAGAVQQALAAARAEHGARTLRGEWLVVQGDALRALGDSQQAVQAYRAAQAALAGEARDRAAFKAADLLLRVIGDPSGALRVIDGARLDAPNAPLRERALLLRIEARHRLGQRVRALARQYLTDYPDSAGAAPMRALIASADPQ